MSEQSSQTGSRRWLLPVVIGLAAIVLLQIGVAYLVADRDEGALEGGFLLQEGQPIGGDFVLYYAASTLAEEGAPAAVYDPAVLHEAEKAAVGAEVPLWPWFYPPTLLMAVLPLAWLPFLAALGVWLTVQLVAYLTVAYNVAPHRLTPIAALLFPAAADALFSGQNGCLNAVLIGGALLLLERRPLLAGVLIGLLTYKPHLGILIPVALIAGGYWRTVLAAALTAVVLVALSVAVFGVEPWRAFLDAAPLARLSVEEGLAAWSNMPTAFVAARMLGLEVAPAWAVQGAAALAAAVAVAWLWRRPVPLGVRAAGLVLAMPLATPYAQFYDLAILVLPILWLFREGRTSGWMGGELVLLIALWVAPVAGQILAQETVFQIWPLILALALWLVLRRAAQLPTG
jgi:hypothetical protein